jgi:hypothetical protein
MISKSGLFSALSAAWCLIVAVRAGSADGPDPIHEKAEPATMAEMAKQRTEGVSAVEVKDCAPGRKVSRA